MCAVTRSARAYCAVAILFIAFSITRSAKAEVSELEAVVFPPNVDERIEAIRDIEQDARHNATGAEQVEVLAQVTRLDPEPEVRAHALRVLATIERGEIDALLRQARTSDPDQRVRETATRMLEARRHARQRPSPPPPPPGRRAFVVGLAILSISYGLSVLSGIGLLIAGAASDSPPRVSAGWQLLIPVAGPICAAFSSENYYGTLGIAALGAVLQSVGIVMLNIGFARHHRARRSRDEEPRARRGPIALMPTFSRGHAAGAAVVGAF